MQNVTSFFGAFIVALVVQWKLALITTPVIPALLIISTFCVAADAKIESRVMRIYSKAGVVAQESVSSIRTVHAFWAHSKLTKRYNNFLQEAKTEGSKKSIIFGVLYAADYFLVYSGIALAFWQGYRMFASGEIPDVSKVWT